MDLLMTAAGRLGCSAVRMNMASVGTGCSAEQPYGPYGPDRVTWIGYDPLGRIYQVRTAIGTAEVADVENYGYTPSGNIAAFRDANGNLIQRGQRVAGL